MTKKKTTQSTKTDSAEQFATEFFQKWQEQWQELLQQQGMPGSLETLGLPPGFIPLQQLGPMGLMAPMGAVAMANLKMLQDVQERIAKLEKAAKKPVKKTPVKSRKK